MNGAIPPLPQYDFMVWCPVKAQGQLYLYLYLYLNMNRCRDSSEILRYELDDRGSIPGRGWEFSLHHRVHTGFGAHPTSYQMGTGYSFSGGKAAGT
jgi:hypothetical protein